MIFVFILLVTFSFESFLTLFVSQAFSLYFVGEMLLINLYIIHLTAFKIIHRPHLHLNYIRLIIICVISALTMKGHLFSSQLFLS